MKQTSIKAATGIARAFQPGRNDGGKTTVLARPAWNCAFIGKPPAVIGGAFCSYLPFFCAA